MSAPRRLAIGILRLKVRNAGLPTGGLLFTPRYPLYKDTPRKPDRIEVRFDMDDADAGAKLLERCEELFREDFEVEAQRERRGTLCQLDVTRKISGKN